MFSTKTQTIGDLQLIVLENLTNNTTVEIIPACGGILHAFNVVHHNSNLNIIDGYESREDFDKNVTAKGFKGCKLSPFACRINKGKYHFNETDYTVEKFYLEENAIHGLIFDAAFDVLNQYADETHAGVTLQYSYNAQDKGYPFQYDCEITYQLEAANKLVLTTKIINRSNQNIPVQDGWHPYFKLGGKINDLQLEFQSEAHVLFNDRLIPTGEKVRYEKFHAIKKIEDQFFDDCFALNMAECQPLCVLRDPAQKIQIEIRPGKSYPFIQFYTPGHRESIAIENLSAPPDCFNSEDHLIILAPGEATYFNTAYQVKAL